MTVNGRAVLFLFACALIVCGGSILLLSLAHPNFYTFFLCAPAAASAMVWGGYFLLEYFMPNQWRATILRWSPAQKLPPWAVAFGAGLLNCAARFKNWLFDQHPGTP
jgi:hypothetical protein